MASDYIERSHKRCIDMGVDFTRIYSSKILQGDQLYKKLDENQNLIITASPFMNQLYNFVKGSGFFAILTDGEGCILNVIGDENVLDHAFKLEMIPGAYMSEESIGTNAMGTAIVEAIPVQVSGEEHFIKAYHRWTCSAAPIRNEAGKIIGTLNLTGNSNLVHSHTLGMVVAAVNAIENMLLSKETNTRLSVAKRYIETIVDSITSGIFTIGPKGYLKTINKTATEMIGIDQQGIEGVHISEIVDGWQNTLDSFYNSTPCFEEESYIKSKAGKIHCTLSVYPILDNIKQLQGMVCVVKEIRKVRKLANRIAGRQAYYTFDKIIGRNQRFLRTIEYAKRIANSPSTVLITGESGTGKEVFAQSIHNHSSRKDEAFVALNCGALPRNLIESELFGYEDGAFTGAKRGGQAGKFELADGGTMFLDEIGEMPLDMQTKLLRVLEEGSLFRIGGSKEIEVDVRVIAATNKNLREEVEKGNFRKDLYYRLNVLPIELIPLRERKDDIPLLVDFFMTLKALKLSKSPLRLKDEVLGKMQSYSWPGNIRELENVIEHFMNSGNSEELSIDYHRSYSEREMFVDEVLNLEEVEKRHIIKILDKYNYNITLTAEALGIGRNTLYRKIEKYSISCD